MHFDNEWDIYINSKLYEEIGYGQDLDLMIIYHYSHVSNSTRSGCKVEV